MGNLDFLLQKKGDRQWGTAHKTELKLKSGNYRIAAKGDTSIDVAVTITFEGDDGAGNPLVKTQTRAKRTNARGLLAILPFTNLRPGQWTITCQSLDAANPWEKSLELSIFEAIAKPKNFRPLPLPPNPNLFSFEGSLSLSPDATSTPIGADTEESVLERSLAKLLATGNDALSADALRSVVESNFQDLDEQASEDEDTEDWSDTQTAAGLLQGSLQELEELLQQELEPIWQEMDWAAKQQAAIASNEPVVVDPPCIAIRLSQNLVTWQQGQPVIVTGELQDIEPIPALYQNALAHLKLRLTLINPQNAQQQVTVEQEITPPTFPQSFRQVLAIDPDWHTLAVIGEIVLMADVHPAVIFATQSFHLVADYQAIAAQIKLPEVPPEDEALLQGDASTLSVPNPVIIAETVSRSEGGSSILPPKLKTNGGQGAIAPELPAFMQTPKRSDDGIGEAVLEDNPRDEQAEQKSVPALPGGDRPIAFTDLTTTPQSGTPKSESAEPEIPYPFVYEPEEPTSEESAPQPTVEETPEDNADLDWNSRFFQRLNTMATEVGDSSWLEEPNAPEPSAPESVVILQNDVMVTKPLMAMPVDLDGAEPTAASPTDREVVVEAEPSRQTMEIVVDSLWDEQEKEQEAPETPATQPAYDASGLLYPQAFLVPPPGEENVNPSAIARREPVPEPILSLSKPEYQAEDMAVVRVTLPPHPDRLYVKLWLQDRQTRNLLSGPYQLTDFTPDKQGNAETLMQISIPPGSIEVRFEAIAINPRYQEESRKVGVDRRVIPKNVSEIDWDDFGV